MTFKDDNYNNIKERFRQIAAYLEFNRGVGHTTVLKEGAINHPEAIVLVGHYNNKKDFPRNDVVSINGADWDVKLRGQQRPLAIDNYAMHMLAVQAARAIDKLQKDAQDHADTRQALKQALSDKQYWYEMQKGEKSKNNALWYCLENGILPGTDEFNIYMRDCDMEEYIDCDHETVELTSLDQVYCQDCGATGSVSWDD